MLIVILMAGTFTRASVNKLNRRCLSKDSMSGMPARVRAVSVISRESESSQCGADIQREACGLELDKGLDIVWLILLYLKRICLTIPGISIISICSCLHQHIQTGKVSIETIP